MSLLPVCICGNILADRNQNKLYLMVVHPNYLLWWISRYYMAISIIGKSLAARYLYRGEVFGTGPDLSSGILYSVLPSSNITVVALSTFNFKFSFLWALWLLLSAWFYTLSSLRIEIVLLCAFRAYLKVTASTFMWKLAS